MPTLTGSYVFGIILLWGVTTLLSSHLNHWWEAASSSRGDVGEDAPRHLHFRGAVLNALHPEHPDSLRELASQIGALELKEAALSDALAKWRSAGLIPTSVLLAARISDGTAGGTDIGYFSAQHKQSPLSSPPPPSSFSSDPADVSSSPAVGV